MNKFYDIDNTEFAIVIQRSEPLSTEELNQKVAAHTAFKNYFESIADQSDFNKEMMEVQQFLIDQLITYGRSVTTDEMNIIEGGFVFRKLNEKDEVVVRVDPTTGKAI